MALNNEYIDQVQKFLDEHYKGKFEIVDLFRTEGKNGYSINLIENQSVFFKFMGYSLSKKECYPPILKDFFIVGETEWEISFQNFQMWVASLGLK